MKRNMVSSYAKLNMQQTNVAALAPPNQRSKCRYMNLEKLINWAMKIILMSDDKIADIVDLELKRKNLDSWMFFFVHHIKRWKRINDNAQLIIQYVDKNGIYFGLTEDLNKQLAMLTQCEESLKFAKAVLEVLKKQEQQIPETQRMLASSDIIESVFGKFKNIEKEQSSSGFTNLLLALPALVGETTVDTIKTVFDQTRVTNVWDWMKDNIGISLQGKRNFCFQGA